MRSGRVTFEMTTWFKLNNAGRNLPSIQNKCTRSRLPCSQKLDSARIYNKGLRVSNSELARQVHTAEVDATAVLALDYRTSTR